MEYLLCHLSLEKECLCSRQLDQDEEAILCPKLIDWPKSLNDEAHVHILTQLTLMIPENIVIMDWFEFLLTDEEQTAKLKPTLTLILVTVDELDQITKKVN
ncbi:hypothetical protein Ciccas_010971 [Cichlidogyrus casuarinus]|uniref:Uncharacterized protein n=1 Tax=Cichlidogyrus casuarinus TaxID=1844966 RepID=A0ABD2PVI4_9PLAT